ncbi:F0F1 ATP synthase subunit B [Paralimibaculum aggregatum]|uniref:ATP synthase subunit b n=1 Tax=Paralimibaculum aggregatum TaxID=3036245 RepID=A0ABQ6LTS4_9RHOB|nr:ATP F0F1 synthase subunit B [Limibaculum sp. NKW23]GMG85468.1 F0F1 ATP synthase subunit B [Limibaculum sp. NKW23]
MEFLYDSNVVVTISFTVFVGILAYVGVHKLLLKALDDRADRIRRELDEARRLREEAQATFAEFERKQREVSAQAEDIVSHAREEAEAAAVRAKEDVKASIARRLKAADEQIAQAEQSAVREVRDRAVEVAVAAARRVITERLGDDKASQLIDDSIESVGQRLH